MGYIGAAGGCNNLCSKLAAHSLGIIPPFVVDTEITSSTKRVCVNDKRKNQAIFLEKNVIITPPLFTPLGSLQDLKKKLREVNSGGYFPLIRYPKNTGPSCRAKTEHYRGGVLGQAGPWVRD